MNKKIVGVIPARYSSTRLPGKMLADLHGKPLIVRTLSAVQKSRLLDDIIVATDDIRIEEAVNEAGGKAVMTDPDLPSGSDRVRAALADIEADIVVNIQGDEPLLPSEVIDSTVELIVKNESFSVTTAASPLKAVEINNPDIVKVVTDRNSRALYFSRAPIPYPRDPGDFSHLFKRHIGIYVYRRDVLDMFCNWEQSELEKCEKLEQLRLIENGINIGVANVETVPPGVDTAEDLKKVLNIMKNSRS